MVRGTEDRAALLDVYRSMVTARLVDRQQVDLARRGEAYFHIPGEGHEPVAALGPHLTTDDWIAAHYRDKALLCDRFTGSTHASSGARRAHARPPDDHNRCRPSCQRPA